MWWSDYAESPAKISNAQFQVLKEISAVTVGAQTCCALGFLREIRAQRVCAPTAYCIVTAQNYRLHAGRGRTELFQRLSRVCFFPALLASLLLLFPSTYAETK